MPAARSLTQGLITTMTKELSPDELASITKHMGELCATQPDATPPPTEFMALSSIRPEDIPHLRWIIRDFLLCGELTLLGGAGGTGKSLLAWSIAASVAAGRAFAHFEAPDRPRNVIILSGEDDRFEVARRVAACCGYAGLEYALVASRMLILPERAIFTLASLESGSTMLAKAVRELIAEKDAGLLVADPLVAVGAGFSENDNSDMERMFDVLRSIVAGTDCAGLLIDHFAKGADASSASAIRGASAKVNAARCAATLSVVSETEYKRYRSAGFSDPRERFIQFLMPKSNYGRRSPPHVFRLLDHDCGNGETRPVYSSCEAMLVYDSDHWEHRDAFLQLVGKGEWRSARSGPADRRLDLAMVEKFGITLQAAWRWLDAFEADGVICRVKRDNMRYELTRRRGARAKAAFLDGSEFWADQLKGWGSPEDRRSWESFSRFRRRGSAPAMARRAVKPH